MERDENIINEINGEQAIAVIGEGDRLIDTEVEMTRQETF